MESSSWFPISRIALLSIGLIVLGLPIYYYKQRHASRSSDESHVEVVDG